MLYRGVAISWCWACYVFSSAKAEREFAIFKNPFLNKLAKRGSPVAANLILSAAVASSTRSMRTAQVDASKAAADEVSKVAADEAGGESSSSDSD